MNKYQIRCDECFGELEVTRYESGIFVKKCDCWHSDDKLENAEFSAFENGTNEGYDSGKEDGLVEGFKNGRKDGTLSMLKRIQKIVNKIKT